MKNLQITARYQIHNGKCAEFKKIAEECLSIVNAKDTDTLQYDWYFDETKTECVLREAYTDSDALLAHFGNIGDLFGKLVAIGDLSAEVYGQPSEELLQATKGLNIKVYNYFQGI
jgi:quinol monooxygenase YgiN